MNDTPYLGQSTDLVLGQEFLTWLWFRSATGAVFNDKNKRPFTTTMEQRIVVQGGEGDSIETASVSGLASELREARLGLTTGKKVTRALIKIERDIESWQFTLKAADFSISSLKPPKVERESDDDTDGAFLEKLFLIDGCLELLDILYTDFLRLRFSKNWGEEVKELRHWMQH